MPPSKQKTVTQKLIDGSKIASAVLTIASAIGVAWAVIWGPLNGAFELYQGILADRGLLREVVQVQRDNSDAITRNVETLRTLNEASSNNTRTLSQMVSRIEHVEERKAAEALPALTFEERGHRITDGRVGGVVRLRWRFRKLRDCGTPRVDLVFINGGGRHHRFYQVSILDLNRRGISFPVAPNRIQTIEYTARIPADEGVEATAGEPAYGFVEVDYPEKCPLVAPARSPDVPFRILASSPE